MRITALVIASIFLTAIYPAAIHADRSGGSVYLSANPDVIAADGKSVCTVTARIRDTDNTIVPDGTEVQFSASLGMIEESVRTSAGVARVQLVSSAEKGTCLVTATWEGGSNTIAVEFGDETSTVKGPEYVSISAEDYLGYSVDSRMFDAAGKVKFRYRGLQVEAGQLQVDLIARRIVARGDGLRNPVKLETRDGTVEAHMLACDFTGSGFLISSGKSVVAQVDTSRSKPTVDYQQPSFVPEDVFDFTDLTDSAVFIKASDALVFLDDKIQFKRATMYVDGKRMFSLPFYVLSMSGYEVDGEQYIGYSTRGITLNLPFYYSLSPSSTGAVLLRHGERMNTGWGTYGQDPGWSLDLRQKYATERFSGTLELSQITRSDWGAHFTHSHNLDENTSAYLFLDYPAHRDLFGFLNVNRSFKGFSVGLNLYGSDYSFGQESLSGVLTAQTRAKPIGKSPFSYTVQATTSYSRDSYESEYQQGVSVREGWTRNLQGKVHSKPIPLSKEVSLVTSAGLGYLWSDREDASGLSTLGTASLSWRPSPRNTVQLSYRFTDRASVYSTRSGKQSVSANWQFYTDRMRGYLYATKGLDYDALNVYGGISYVLDDKWRVGLRSTNNKFGYLQYEDLEIALSRRLGSREITAIWSQSQNKLLFELGSGRF